jgi:hypothetical protein
VLGRNAAGISFVTGFGVGSPQHPHHRSSEADRIAAPIPGLSVGGPNPGQQDLKGCVGLAHSRVLAVTGKFEKQRVDVWIPVFAKLADPLHERFVGQHALRVANAAAVDPS